jgi:hypothetical protein
MVFYKDVSSTISLFLAVGSVYVGDQFSKSSPVKYQHRSYILLLFFIYEVLYATLTTQTGRSFYSN